MKKLAVFGQAITLAVLTLALTGCPPKKKPITPVEETPQAMEPPVDTPSDADIQIGTDWTAPQGLETVHFNSNKSELTPEARSLLKKNSAVVKAVLAQAPSVQVRLEGHCDERNTLEYNLALGQRRANAVRDYYVSLGISKAALTTISYGEEKPVCATSDDSCWMRNRRGVTTLRSTSGPIRIPANKLSSAQ